MLGLAPMKTEDDALLKRQFLYQFKQMQTTMDLNESYAFNGGSVFAVGGNAEDYESLVCEGGNSDSGVGFTLKPAIKEDAMPEATNSLNFAPEMYYRGADLMLKI